MPDDELPKYFYQLCKLKETPHLIEVVKKTGFEGDLEALRHEYTIAGYNFESFKKESRLFAQFGLIKLTTHTFTITKKGQKILRILQELEEMVL